jgi:two-component system response regulator DevR
VPFRPEGARRTLEDIDARLMKAESAMSTPIATSPVAYTPDGTSSSERLRAAQAEPGAETATAGPAHGVPSIRVFLLDDHEIVRRGIKELLESEGDIEVVGESGLAHEAVERIPALRPNVAILDGRLPDGSGIDVCREVRSVDPSIAALILTSYDDDEALFAAILAGASGYVLKQVRGNDLIDTVRRVASGQSTLDPSVTARVLERLRDGSRSDPELDALSAQEQRILDLIGTGLTNREIAERMALAEKTVKNYVSSVLAKLGLKSRTQAAIFVTRHPHA